MNERKNNTDRQFSAVTVAVGLKSLMDDDIAEVKKDFPTRKKPSYSEMIATYREVWKQAKAQNDAAR